MDCGQSFPYYVMDFDHVRGTKIRNLSAGWQSASRSALEGELAKCEVVCSNCHRIRTFKRITAKKKLPA